MPERKPALLPLFQDNQVLFGHDPTPALVACEIEGGSQVRLYWRRAGAIGSELAPFTPLLILEGEAGLKGWTGEAKIEKLTGRGSFNRLVLFPDIEQLDDAKSYLQKKTGKSPSAADASYWYFSDALHQFLLVSGKTQFKGMTFRDLNRLQIDIETYCQDGFSFPNAARDTDRITAIALADSGGWERLISGKEFAEAEMLRELVQEVQRRDPDVIEGHNFFRFDLEYIEARRERQIVSSPLILAEHTRAGILGFVRQQR
jgi:hypothetical protein